MRECPLKRLKADLEKVQHSGKLQLKRIPITSTTFVCLIFLGKQLAEEGKAYTVLSDCKEILELYGFTVKEHCNGVGWNIVC